MSDNNNIVDKAKGLAKNAGNAIKDSAGKVGDSIKEFVKDTGDKMNESKNERDEKKYAPVTREKFEKSVNELPKMIHIMETDKYKKYEACKDAIAYLPLIGSHKVLEIERKNLNLLKVNFYPHQAESLYIKDPYSPLDNPKYVDISEYFNYLFKNKASELSQVANSLGAKHIFITYEETRGVKKVTNINKNVNAKGIQIVDNDLKGNGNLDLNIINAKGTSLVVASDDVYEGSDEPVRPELVYYKNSPDVENLIKMCMDKKNRPKKKEFSIKYSSTQDLDISFASDIDIAINKLNIKGVSDIKRKVEKENTRMLKYVIEF